MSGVRFDVLQDLAAPERDIAAFELWERSLYRSRQRRRLAEVGRKSRRRRKGAALATTTALAAVPVIPQTLAAAEVPGSNSSAAGAVGGNAATLTAAAQRVVLEQGSQGALVAALQRRLNEVLPLTHIAVDGIFGPQTRGAVLEFQRREGVPASGTVDARDWAVLFKAPVLVFSGTDSGGSGSNASAQSSATNGSVPAARTNTSHSSRAPAKGGANNGSRKTVSHQSRHVGGPPTVNDAAGQATDSAGTPSAGGPSTPGTPSNDNAGTPSNNNAPAASSTPSGSSHPTSGKSGAPPVSVVSPTSPRQQSSTYVLTGGVALPLPRQYLTGGFVDAGVDYAAPGGTPEYAMGDGVIIGEGISGFGPNAPILKITDGPLKGMEIYYGHAGPDLVRVGQHVHAGQQITIIGYGIVGISTGPHLEVGFYPPSGSGSRMLSLINSMLSQHPTGRAWGSGGKLLARMTRRRARAALARRSYLLNYSGTGGGSGGTSVGAVPVTSSAPAVVTSTPPAAAPAAPSSAPAAAPTTAAPAESAPTSPAPAAAPSAPAVADSGDATPSAPAPASEVPQSAPTVDSAQSAPTTTSAPEAGGGATSGSSLATPAGSSGATTTTTGSAPVQPATGPEETAPKGPQELSSTSSAPAQVGPASASTGSATTAGTASTATTSAVTATSHSGPAAAGPSAAPSESGAAHSRG